MWSAVCTLGGLLLVILGVACSVAALVRTARDHGRQPFSEAATRVRLATRPPSYRMMPWRRRSVVVHDAAAALMASSSLTARAVVGGPDVPSDVSLHKQIHLLMRRIENIESQADHDRVYYAEQNRTLNEWVDSLDRRTCVADEELKEIFPGYRCRHHWTPTMGIIPSWCWDYAHGAAIDLQLK